MIIFEHQGQHRHDSLRKGELSSQHQILERITDTSVYNTVTPISRQNRHVLLTSWYPGLKLLVTVICVSMILQDHLSQLMNIEHCTYQDSF